MTAFCTRASDEPNWPERTTQIGNCFRNQFEVPVLFYVLIALALPLRHADLFIVLMSWVFVVTRFAEISLETMARAILPWLVPLVSVLLAITLWPPLTTWLPQFLGRAS